MNNKTKKPTKTVTANQTDSQTGRLHGGYIYGWSYSAEDGRSEITGPGGFKHFIDRELSLCDLEMLTIGFKVGWRYRDNQIPHQDYLEMLVKSRH
jgi:hypothetical protein